MEIVEMHLNRYINKLIINLKASNSIIVSIIELKLLFLNLNYL